MKSNLCLPLLFLLLYSCANNQLIENHVKNLEHNQVKSDFYKDFEVSKGSKNYLLNTQEVGRTAFMLNRTDLTTSTFIKTTEQYNSLDERATVNAKGVSSGVLASTVGSDNNREYIGSDFERSLDYFYNAINYLKIGQLQKAMVELRAADNIQKFSQAKREKQIYEAEASTQYNFSDDINNAIAESQNTLQGTKKRFLNPYIYYISGNIRELNGDANGALVDYKAAAELYPNNPYVIADALRLSELKDHDYYIRLKKAHPIFYNKDYLYKRQKTVIIVYEQGFVPSKTAINGKIFLINGIYGLSLPAYSKQQDPLADVNIELLNNGKNVSSAQAAEIVNIYTLAKNDLAENYKGIVARQVSRLITKSAMQEVGRENDKPLLQIVGGFSSLLEQADVRSFRTLPSYVQVAKINTNANFNSVDVKINGRTVTFNDMLLHDNNIIIFYVIDLGFSVYKSVVYQGKK